MSARTDAAEARHRAFVAETGRVLAALDHGAGAPPAGAPPPSALDALTAAFNLSPFERDLLLLCAAYEADPAAAALLDRIQPGAPYPTFGLALARLPGGHWSALSPAGPLRYWELVDLPGDGPLVARRLRCSERVLHHLIGADYLDAELAAILRPLPPPAGGASPHTTALRELLAGGLAVLAGDDAQAKRGAIAALALESRRPVFVLRGEDVPAAPHDRARTARLWEREAALTGALLLLELDGDAPAGVTFAEELRAPLAVAAANTPPGLHRPHGRLVVNRPRWRAGADAPAANRAALGDLAQEIEPLAAWDDLVLPGPQLDVLRQVALHVRHADRVYREWGMATKSARGLGISALFAGPSGTGKTMAAEVLANELALPLYRIDLATVVSKYVGETEKNLRRIFDAAEEAGAILLFDEADALFGKRSDVRDSHDRYANIEVSYLLQRMESYAGLAILTTNMKQALDAAFLRRLRFVVHFPFPDAAQRAEIWRRVFPGELPRYELDVQRLAQLNVAGGNIRNIALHAAFLAASNGGAVTMAHLLQSARGEYARLEKPLSEAETRGWA
ncbi:MAG: ATP-binding protein [Dehalococcoidia bacterium]|nr:ATP-binding protein [Dehalococcoidia bacterium]